MQLTAATCSLILLTACSPQPPCVAPKDWTTDEQIAIAREREQLPPDDILRFVLDDWERMRRAAR